MVESLAKVATDLVKHPIKTPKSLASDEAQAEAFASLKSEVDRQGGVQISEPDWELVEKLSIDYLRRVQKDLRAASYLARAWSEQHGANGALAGAQLLEQLLATGADKIAPPRVRGRQQALQWWSRQTLVNSCDGLGNTENAEQQKAFLECLDRMSATIESDPKLAGKKELFLDVREELNTDPAELAAYEGMPAEAATAKDAASSSPDKSEPEAPPLVTTYTDDSGADTPADTSPLDADVQDKQSAIDDPTLLKWVAEVQTPVSAESPTGDDLHLSDEFEYLKDQVNNTLRVREVDWQQVFDQSLDYLRLSKDLRVMAYCVFAMVENDGCRGLFRGLVLLSRFLDDFGAECHPHRARARERALRWLAVQTDERLKRHDMTGVSLTELERCARQVDAINDALAEREELLIGGPALAKIGLLVRGEIESKEAEAHEPSNEISGDSARSAKVDGESKPGGAQAQPAPTSRAATTTIVAAPTTGAIEGLDDFRKAVAQGNSYILQLCAYKRSSEPKNPISYKLLRNWLWGTLGENIKPESLSPPAKLPDWDALTAAGDPAKMVEAAENLLPMNRFCLDLNRYTVIALQKMGAADSVAAVHAELRYLLNRFPSLPNDTFKGGDALASAATRSWLDTDVLAEADGIAPLSTSSSVADDDVIAALTDAREAARKGEVAKSIEMLETKVRGARGGSERFGWRAALSRFLLELNAAELALAHVEAMEQEVDDHSLEEWDPDRAMEVAWLALQVDAGVKNKSPCKSRAAAISESGRARICRLAPAVAIEKFGSGRGSR